MFSKLAARITKELLQRRVISSEEQDIYEYAGFILFSYLFFFIVILVAGIIAKIPVESVLFYTLFVYLRNYAGGAHAKTEFRCCVYSTVSLVLSVFVISKFKFDLLFLCLTLISSVFLAFFSPIDTPNKRLSTAKKKRQKRVVVVTLIVLLLAYLILVLYNKYSFASAISISIVLSAFLLLIGKIIKIKENCKINYSM